MVSGPPHRCITGQCQAIARQRPRNQVQRLIGPGFCPLDIPSHPLDPSQHGFVRAPCEADSIPRVIERFSRWIDGGLRLIDAIPHASFFRPHWLSGVLWELRPCPKKRAVIPWEDGKPPFRTLPPSLNWAA
jgi:hypothetical protein